VHIFLLRTDTVIAIIVNFIRFQSFIIEPFMPSCSAKINFLLGLEDRTPRDDKLGGFFNNN
ncbi:MAG: hypothetical protein KDD45_17450, partial [Bdellovibrionales bacterium]|nr:hypothetical protein [Bdellovibrionales bacterium]